MENTIVVDIKVISFSDNEEELFLALIRCQTKSDAHWRVLSCGAYRNILAAACQFASHCELNQALVSRAQKQVHPDTFVRRVRLALSKPICGATLNPSKSLRFRTIRGERVSVGVHGINSVRELARTSVTNSIPQFKIRFGCDVDGFFKVNHK